MSRTRYGPDSVSMTKYMASESLYYKFERNNFIPTLTFSG